MRRFEDEVADLAARILRRRGVPFTHDRLEWVVRNVLGRRRKPADAREAAQLVVERVATTARRLGHGTGATDWR